jgi:hypothetical protein
MRVTDYGDDCTGFFFGHKSILPDFVKYEKSAGMSGAFSLFIWQLLFCTLGTKEISMLLLETEKHAHSGDTYTRALGEVDARHFYRRMMVGSLRLPANGAITAD